MTRALRRIEENGLLHKTCSNIEVTIDEDGKERRKYTRTQQVEELDSGVWQGFPVVRVFNLKKIYDAIALNIRGANEAKKPTHKVAKTRADHLKAAADAATDFSDITGPLEAAKLLNI